MEMSSQGNTDDAELFYERLVSFSDFSDLTNDEHYTRAPPGWTVVITDVKGSTKAIEAGRYKDVNLIGAAGIVTVQNLLKAVDFPYVFGGDGATMLIPNRHTKAVAKELAALKNLSEKNFGLALRVGMVDISEVTTESISVEVAKYELCKGKCIAFFQGGGLTDAEEKVKGNPEVYEIPETKSLSVDLGGLTCRWKDIPNKRGRVMSLLVSASLNKGKEPYVQFLDKLKKVVSDLNEAHPVHAELMTYRTVTDCVKDEKRYVVRNPIAWTSRRVEIALANRLFTTRKPVVGIDPLPYIEAMQTHSDHQKFDDILRMVLDCADDEADSVEEYLKQAHERGELCYGIHYSPASCMTCYVQGMDDGKHVHFIDGGDGGYAIAAKQLKYQISQDRQRSMPIH
jgi:hypothetical protein